MPKNVPDIATGFLGDALAQRCFHGPAETLNLTEDTLPAIIATQVPFGHVLSA